MSGDANSILQPGFWKSIRQYTKVMKEDNYMAQ